MLHRIESTLSNFSNLFALVARVFLGLAMCSHGYMKLMDMNQFISYLEKMQFPMPAASGVLAMLAELLGGVLVAIGFKTRISSLLVVSTMLVAGLGAHLNDPFAKKELSLVYAAAFLLLIAFGPGKFSVDKH